MLPHLFISIHMPVWSVYVRIVTERKYGTYTAYTINLQLGLANVGAKSG